MTSIRHHTIYVYHCEYFYLVVLLAVISQTQEQKTAGLVNGECECGESGAWRQRELRSEIECDIL